MPNPMSTPCGVYRITCLANGKVYIGSSHNIYQRITDHIEALRINRHVNKQLQRAWVEYGSENFEWEVIELCHPDDRVDAEFEHMAMYPKEKLFNRLVARQMNKPYESSHYITLEDGRVIGRRNKLHPEYKDVDRRPKGFFVAPKGIGWQSWEKIRNWIPKQIERGLPIGRDELSQAIGVSPATITSRNWLLPIYEAYSDYLEWELDPNYLGKRGRKIMRLRPK